MVSSTHIPTVAGPPSGARADPAGDRKCGPPSASPSPSRSSAPTSSCASRSVHLATHLEFYPVLTEAQRARHGELRGSGHRRRPEEGPRGDPDAAAALFSETAEYHETPFDEPFRGRDAIRGYWRDATSTQRIVSFSHEILSVASDRGIARWTAEFVRVASGRGVRLDGILVLLFEEDGRCRVLREWWHASTPPEPDA
ncbi:MAG: nuclear transport factor 2 family protein [Gemmatimonadetes bacterium]|nr:nuclear transport factor 2 family protein [Gemmatimonadota bacterium]